MSVEEKKSIEEKNTGQIPAERPIVRVTIRADENLAAAVGGFLGAVARRCGLEDHVADTGRLAEAICRQVVASAFDPGEEGDFSIELIRRPSQVVLVIEDRGLPTAPDALKGGKDGIGMPLLDEWADEVVFRNLGRNGKRIEYIRHHPIRSIEEYITDDEKHQIAAAAEPAKAEDAVALRLLEPADAVALSRLIYRAYGYTYGSDFVYYPDRVVEMLESGRMESCVAVNEAGQLVGHVAMLLHKPGARSGETAVAVVDPRYRGRKLFEQMKEYMREHARQRGMFGLYSEAVAVHTFTQRGNLALGGFETGYLLGFTPNTQVFRKIREDQPRNRQTAVLFYVRTNDEPLRAVHAPEHHAAMIERIYRRGALNRTLLPPPPDLTLHAVRDHATRLDINARPDVGRAFLMVHGYGVDVLRRVHEHVRDLCRRGIACIYLDLPLGDPMTSVLCKAFESLGFSIAGLILELIGGDVLRLQYLNGVSINPDDIQVASDFGRELLGYVLEARATMQQLHTAA